jgi:hypothetical protein
MATSAASPGYQKRILYVDISAPMELTSAVTTVAIGNRGTQTMTLVYVPVLSPGEYDAIRHILKDDLPASFDDWAALHVKYLGDILHQGHQYKEIPVHADELAQFCDAHPHRRDHEGLTYFANQKGSQTP